MTTLSGTPCFDFMPDFSAAPKLKYSTVQDMAGSFGDRIIGSPDLKPQSAVNLQYQTKQAITAFQIEAFFEAVGGRRDSFWLPSWRNQIIPYPGGVLPGATTIKIPAVSYGNLLNQPNPLYASGAWIFLFDYIHAPEFVQVQSVATAGGYDTLTLASAVQGSYPRRRFMCGICYLVRFAQDQISPDWMSPNVAKYQLGFIETINWRPDIEPQIIIPGFPEPPIPGSNVPRSITFYSVYSPRDGTPDIVVAAPPWRVSVDDGPVFTPVNGVPCVFANKLKIDISGLYLFKRGFNNPAVTFYFEIQAGSQAGLTFNSGSLQGHLLGYPSGGIQLAFGTPGPEMILNPSYYQSYGYNSTLGQTWEGPNLSGSYPFIWALQNMAAPFTLAAGQTTGGAVGCGIYSVADYYDFNLDLDYHLLLNP